MPPTTNQPRTDAVGQLETQLAVLARRLEHTSRRSPTFRRLDRAGYLLARTLEANGPLTVNRLAQTLGLDGSTVTRQVAALADRGFVTRTPDPDDGRATVVALSAAGRREMETVRGIRSAKLDQSVADWPTTDVEQLAILLGRLNGTLVTDPPPDRAPTEAARPGTRVPSGLAAAPISPT